MEKFNMCLCDKFDLYAGTSVGGMLAGCFAYNRCPCDIDDYIGDNIERVFKRKGFAFPFSNKYSSKGKEELISKVLPNVCLNGDPLDTQCQTYDYRGKKIKIKRYHPKPLLIPVYNASCKKADIFKSTSKRTGHISLYDAVNATSAAPSYFSPVKINHEKYVDGGIGAHDPVMCAYSEAKHKWKNEEIRVLSVGTGYVRREVNHPSDSWGKIQVLLYGDIVNSLISASADFDRGQIKKLVGNNYLRINSELQRSIEMDSIRKLDMSYLRNLGRRWFTDFEMQIDKFFSEDC